MLIFFPLKQRRRDMLKVDNRYLNSEDYSTGKFCISMLIYLANVGCNFLRKYHMTNKIENVF